MAGDNNTALAIDVPDGFAVEWDSTPRPHVRIYIHHDSDLADGSWTGPQWELAWTLDDDEPKALEAAAADYFTED